MSGKATGFSTRAVHAGEGPDSVTGAHGIFAVYSEHHICARHI